ncbi:MAG: Type 1 glutamine amidotransferase-like domain-containing protein [Microlunatus sp.]|nr:Type 1 glutamine amidotransferase-like domain-containing protein [Microlunatus sp.]
MYWPFALPAEMARSADSWLRGSLDALGISYRLDTWQHLADHGPPDLDPESVDLLFVGGGNTFGLLDQVRRHGFIEPVRRFWRAGGDYYGGSAGAVLACESIEIAAGLDPNEPGLKDLAALGLLSGAAVLPHFTDEQLAEAGRWAAQHSTVVLGLPDSIGLRCGAGRATVVGAGHLSRVSPETVERFAPGDVLDLDVG